MSEHADVIIAGLGAMGSAAAAHLAARGVPVLGFDRFTPPHALGSSHGQTRVIREAYFEDPVYVPMVQRAYDLWHDLETASGQQLYLPTGGLMIGPADGVLVSGARRSAETHRLKHEVLEAQEIRRRFPAFHVPDRMSGIWEPRAGILFPERCIEVLLEQARRMGADLHTEEPIERWEATDDDVTVTTAQGRYTAGQLLLTAGSWLPGLWTAGHRHLQVERQSLFWFDPRTPDLFRPEKCPIHMWEYGPGRHFYGMPDLGHGAKVAVHYQGEATQPDEVRRDVSRREIQAMQELVAPYLPGLGDRCVETAVCLYTNTPDGHFLIDRHPDHAKVWLVSPCSGHGFKFSPVIGEMLADLATGTPPRYPLEAFRLNRLGRSLFGAT